HRHAPVGLLRQDPWHHIQPMRLEVRLTVREGDVHLVDEVLDVLEVVALADVGRGAPYALLLEGREARQRRGLALAQVDEDQTQIFLRGKAPNADPLTERLRLGRLLDALPAAVVLPAVVEAAQLIALDPPR